METKEEKVKLPMPARSIKVKIGINEYEIKLPTNGQRIDIESTKLRMTNSKHQDMLYGNEEAMDAYLLTSAIATFSILIPDLSRDLVGASLLELDPLQSKTLIKAYEKYYDWNKSWREFINQDTD